jgi:hypothetical protein
MRISSEYREQFTPRLVFCCKILPVLKRLIKMAFQLAIILLVLAFAAFLLPRLVTAAYAASRT